MRVCACVCVSEYSRNRIHVSIYSHTHLHSSDCNGHIHVPGILPVHVLGTLMWVCWCLGAERVHVNKCVCIYLFVPPHSLTHTYAHTPDLAFACAKLLPNRPPQCARRRYCVCCALTTSTVAMKYFKIHTFMFLTHSYTHESAFSSVTNLILVVFDVHLYCLNALDIYIFTAVWCSAVVPCVWRLAL
jgi:hypothetical protein